MQKGKALNSLFKKSTLALLVLASSPVFAGGVVNTTQSQTGITQSNQSLTQEKHLQWGLSVDEYSRYEELMEGIRGSISPDTISPLEVLGIHAESEAERAKYARMWADMMEQDAERVLAFQRAYDAAWVEKGNKALIDIAQLQNLSTAPTTTSLSNTAKSVGNTSKLILATSLAGCDACDRKIQQVLTSMMVDPSLQLDIYFSDSSDKENSVIRQWAMKNNIDAEQLRSKKITLNHGQSLMRQYQLDESQLPATFKVNNTGGVKRVE